MSPSTHLAAVSLLLSPLIAAPGVDAAKFEPQFSGQCSDWIYVYDFPPEFNVKLPGYVMADGDIAFPDGVPVSGDGLPEGIYSQWSLGLSAVLFDRFTKHPCRTADPEKASLFYIPYLEDIDAKMPAQTKLYSGPPLPRQDVMKCAKSSAVLDSLSNLKSPSGVSYLDRNQGRDHILVNGLFVGARVSMYCEGLFRSPFSVPSMANVIRLVVEAPGAAGFQGYAEQSAHKIDMTGVTEGGRTGRGLLRGGEREPDDFPLNLHMIPYPSSYHWSPKLGTRSFPWTPRGPRENLAAVSFGEHGSGFASSLRTKLLSQCKQHGEGECAIYNVGEHWSGSRPSTKEDLCNITASVSRLYSSSTFCIQPPGDSPSRKGIVDSFLMGCIPVLFSKDQLALWPWHWPLDIKRRSSVFVDPALIMSGSADVIHLLKEISVEEIHAMQSAIAEFAFSMQYSKIERGFAPPLAKDGFQAVLEHCLELSRLPRDAPSLHTQVEVSQSKVYDSLFPLVSFGQDPIATASGSLSSASSSGQCLDRDIQGEEFCCKLANGNGCALRNALDVCSFACADCIDQTTASSFCRSFSDTPQLFSASSISVPVVTPTVLAAGAILLVLIVLVRFLVTRKAPLPVVVHGALQYVTKMKSPEEND